MSYFQFFVWWCFSNWCGLLDQCKYSKEWDDKLNALLDLHGDSATCDHLTTMLGGTEVWTGNALYAYGFDFSVGQPCTSLLSRRPRPSIRTMHRLYLCSEWVKDGKPSHD